jgi:threonine dehydratase
VDPVTPEAIKAAHPRVPAAFRNMPQFVSEPLTARLGVPVVVKAETANPIGSFKGRGTWLAVSELAAAGEVGEGSGVVLASAGNFGQGVAYTGRTLGVRVIVFAAGNASATKVEAMRRLGAEVRLVGEDFDAARAAAAAFAADHSWRLLIDGQDPWITIGAGTLAVELTEAISAGELPAFEAIYVPVGNGALIGGVGRWLHAALPSVRVIGVQAERAPAMTLSWRERRPIETERADTVADGIAARVPVPEALDIMLDAVDEMQLVNEEAILAAQRELQAELPFTVEPSAGAAWAAMTGSSRPGGPVAMVLTGGNVDRPG